MTDAQKQNIKEMREQGAKLAQIAEALGLSVNTVKSFCRRSNMNILSVPVNLKNEVSVENNVKKDICKHCGKWLEQIPKSKPKTFCCDKCRFDWWNENRGKVKNLPLKNCVHCGRSFEINSDVNRKYCCHACYISNRYGKEAHHDERAI